MPCMFDSLKDLISNGLRLWFFPEWFIAFSAKANSSSFYFVLVLFQLELSTFPLHNTLCPGADLHTLINIHQQVNKEISMALLM